MLVIGIVLIHTHRQNSCDTVEVAKAILEEVQGMMCLFVQRVHLLSGR